MSLITSQLLTEKDDINKVIPECVNLAKAWGAYLPFQYMHMPLVWWDTFNNADDSLFWQKRGKNFLGTQSRLEKFFLLIARDVDSLCGAIPLIEYALKTPSSRDEIRIIAFAGDYVLLPFQDFLIDPKKRQEVMTALLEHITTLLQNGTSAFWAGYLPEESRNLRALKDACAALKSKNMESLEAISCQRGGVWPWTIAGISATLKKMCTTCDKSEEKIDGLEELAAKLVDCTPQSLLFPRTRNNLLQELNALITRIRNHECLSGFVEKLDAFLSNTPVLYPYIELPSDREAYLATLSHSTRRYFRRYMKRFLEAGGSFETIPPEAIGEADIEDYIRLHLLRWGDGSAAICGRSADYHRGISKKMANEGLFSLFFAGYQGKRIAVHSCFDIGGRREGYLTGRDPEFTELRAGRLLYLQTIYDAIDNGFSRYELGAVGFGYKMSFVKKTAVADNVFLYPVGDKPDLDQMFAGFECMEPLQNLNNTR